MKEESAYVEPALFLCVSCRNHLAYCFQTEKGGRQGNPCYMLMKKNYILDTNILLKSPCSILGFEDNNVFITNVSVEELDYKKRSEDNETRYNARCVARLFASLKKKGSLMSGVSLDSGGCFKIIGADYMEKLPELPAGWKRDKPDNIILQIVKAYSDETDEECVLITNDINMQIKADVMGIKVQDYNNERVADDIEIYSGRNEFFVNDNTIDFLYEKGKCKTENIDFYSIHDFEHIYNPKFYENEFITLYSNENQSKSILLIYKNGELNTLCYYNRIQDISPLNSGQYFALEALMAPADEIPLVILQGQAGTAKTFLSLAAGLDEVMNANAYKRVLVCRPNSKFDEDIGFLKGTEMDKIGPLIRPFYDNLEVILEEKGYSYSEIPNIIDDYFDSGYLKAEAMAYMRGRSITNTFIIVDEAQNASPNQILGMITRAGKGSKIIIIGDPNQIDAAKLDKRNNGLVYAAEKMKESPLCASVTFKDGECKRSKLALEAAKYLTKK